jgi:hypothetical protein
MQNSKLLSVSSLLLLVNSLRLASNVIDLSLISDTKVTNTYTPDPNY